MFVYIVRWKDCEGYEQLLTNKEFIIENFELKTNEHNFYEYNSDKFISSIATTYFFVLGSQMAKQHWSS